MRLGCSATPTVSFLVSARGGGARGPMRGPAAAARAPRPCAALQVRTLSVSLTTRLKTLRIASS
jgi:hypothetical protein